MRAFVPERLRRSMLMTPSNRPDRMRKAASCGADALVFDLEDSVPPGAKEDARSTVAQVLASCRDAAASCACASTRWPRGSAPATFAGCRSHGSIR
jgi:citrate lyase beta subunit